MALSYVISWFLNVLFIAIFLAWLDELRGHYVEKKPWILFAISIGLPTLLEVLSWGLEGVPFLALLFPGVFPV